jgi:nitrate reductase beta subunit
VGDLTEKEVSEALSAAKTNAKEADEIFRLTALATFEERFVIPPAHREESIEMIEATGDVKGNTGFGFKLKPARGL